MPKRVRFLAVSLFLAIVGIMCVALALPKAHALGGYKDYEAYDGDGWSITVDGVMTIESNQGWWNAMKHGYEARVHTLVIGRDLTSFRVYNLPHDVPSPDFFSSADVSSYDKDGNAFYDDYNRSTDIYPNMIEVEEGNPAFRVVDGMLINMETGELVLSEVGVTDVVIPEGVQTITRKAFYQRDLISVQFPSSLTRIGENAFSRCVNLKSVDFSDSLIQLEQGAFYDCTSLQEVSLSANLNVIEDYVFGYCSFNYIEIPAKVTEIGDHAFMECDSLQRMILPDGLKKIGDGAFGNCDQLSTIVLPEGLESIGEGAFALCDSLRMVILPDSLQLIGQDAYAYCDLSLLRIPKKLAFTFFYRDRGTIVSPHKKADKSFELSSVDTVILAGSDYDFGYPAISNARNVYFLGTPPEDVGQILDRETVENIYCSDEFEFQWTRSTVASWVRQRLQILPATKLNEQVESIVNATPEPTVTPRPTASPKPTRTPAKTRKPKTTPTQEPSIETTQDTDPILFVFAGVLALVIAGIVVVAVKASARNKKPDKRRKTAR